jgi:hypothetical protein
MENQVDTDDISSEDIIPYLRRLGVSPVVVNILFSALDTSRSTPCKLLGNPFFHRHSQHKNYTNHLADIHQHKASMLSLPVEVLERVVSFSDPKEVKTLRSTCRKLEEAAINSFIDHFVKCRRHAITIHSLKTLVEITIHPYFAKFVEEIILDNTFPFKKVEGVYLDAIDEPLNYEGFQFLVWTALYRLEMQRNHVTLGVTDSNKSCFGLKELLSRPTAHLFKQERHDTFQMLRDFATEKEINLNISGFDLDLSEEREAGNENPEAPKFVSTFGGHVSTLSSDVALNIWVNMLSNSRRDFGLIWNLESKSLDVEGIDIWQGPGSMTSGLFHGTWPSAASIKRLTLSHCDVNNDTDFVRFMDLIRACIETLEQIELRDIIIRDHSRWSLVLHELARASRLQRFELVYLERHVYVDVNSVEEEAIIEQVHDWCGSGDECLSKLASLTALVKADEDKWEAIDDQDSSKWGGFEPDRTRLRDKVNQMLAPTDSGSGSVSQDSDNHRADDEIWGTKDLR